MTYRLAAFKLEKTDPFPISYPLHFRAAAKIPQTHKALSEALPFDLSLCAVPKTQQPGRVSQCQTLDGIFALSHRPERSAPLRHRPARTIQRLQSRGPQRDNKFGADQRDFLR